MLRRAVPRGVIDLNRKRARAQVVVARSFQYRYTVFLTSFGVCFAFIVGGVTLYLLNHNYTLLIREQLLTAPKTVDHLARELKLANEVLVMCLFGFVGFLAMIGIRISHRIVVPVLLIQEKIRGLCRGDLHNAHVHVRKTDEFQEFTENYNYLVEVIKTQTRLDIERLQKLKPDEHNRDAVHLWECMIQEKKAQLNAEPASTDRAVASHRAS